MEIIVVAVLLKAIIIKIISLLPATSYSRMAAQALVETVRSPWKSKKKTIGSSRKPSNGRIA